MGDYFFDAEATQLNNLSLGDEEYYHRWLDYLARIIYQPNYTPSNIINAFNHIEATAIDYKSHTTK